MGVSLSGHQIKVASPIVNGAEVVVIPPSSVSAVSLYKEIYCSVIILPPQALHGSEL